VHRAIRESFGREVAPGALFEADFFTLDASRIGLFNCAVGNPPFIRYQRFNGEQRALALKRAAAGRPALTSAWAPILVHTSTFLQRQSVAPMRRAGISDHWRALVHLTDSAGSEAAGRGSDEVGRKVDAYTGATPGSYLASRRKRHALHSVRQDYGEVVYVFNRGGEGSVLGLVGG
jgi:hypothetical protein